MHTPQYCAMQTYEIHSVAYLATRFNLYFCWKHHAAKVGIKSRGAAICFICACMYVASYSYPAAAIVQ